MESKSLYKYMPHYDGNFLEHFIFRATQRMHLNDPFEFLPPEEFYKAFTKIAESDKGFEWIKDFPYELFCSAFFFTDGIISFSEIRNNLLMWAQYSEKHTGMVLEFDISNEFFEEAEQVKYKDAMPENISNLSDLFLLKSNEWLYEKEYRIVKQLNEHDYYIKKSDMSINKGTGSVARNLTQNENMYMFCIPKASLKSVTFGCYMDKPLKEMILNKIVADKEFVNVEFWQAKLSKEYFHLEFEKIE